MATKNVNNPNRANQTRMLDQRFKAPKESNDTLKKIMIASGAVIGSAGLSFGAYKAFQHKWQQDEMDKTDNEETVNNENESHAEDTHSSSTDHAQASHGHSGQHTATGSHPQPEQDAVKPEIPTEPTPPTPPVTPVTTVTPTTPTPPQPNGTYVNIAGMDFEVVDTATFVTPEGMMMNVALVIDEYGEEYLIYDGLDENGLPSPDGKADLIERVSDGEVADLREEFDVMMPAGKYEVYNFNYDDLDYDDFGEDYTALNVALETEEDGKEWTEEEISEDDATDINLGYGEDIDPIAEGEYERIDEESDNNLVEIERTDEPAEEIVSGEMVEPTEDITGEATLEPTHEPAEMEIEEPAEANVEVSVSTDEPVEPVAAETVERVVVDTDSEPTPAAETSHHDDSDAGNASSAPEIDHHVDIPDTGSSHDIPDATSDYDHMDI